MMNRTFTILKRNKDKINIYKIKMKFRNINNLTELTESLTIKTILTILDKGH